ncbi:hypothetical protein F4803DRAFT_528501 [Xylaria telfairii]|nr:hypothetical protein F4803DRAFT_528501 [Xylaria telfairii]
MATTSSLAVAALPVAAQALQHAVSEFRTALDENQRRELDKFKSIPDADAILAFTAQLDSPNRNRRGRSFASRLHTTLLAVRNFCSVADTFVSAHPEIAALVWGSVKLTMLVMSNYTSYYEATSDLFMRVGRLCPLFDKYLILYQTSTQLRQSLLNFHTAIVHCCKHVVEAVQRPWREQVLRAFWNSFEREFKPDIDNIQRCSNHVKEEIALAQAQADSQEQQLQALEREQASMNRSMVQKLFSRTDNRVDKIHQWQLQSNARKTLKRKQQLLDALSTYDHLRLLKQSRSKRHKNTSSWIPQTPEFHRWIDGEVPLLCFFGKLGSGKTIATASVVDHILSEQGSSCVVSFFFVDSGNLESLSANTIIRSILRQRLDPIQIPQQVEKELERLDSSSGLDELVQILRIVMHPPRISYIIIDGLDECEKPDRVKLLTGLSSLTTPGGNIRLFLSGRDSIRGEIQKQFKTFDSLSMDCPSARDDISMFIKDTVRDRVQNEELSIGDPFLEEDIKLALIGGVQGMFLWVTFQVDEICAQHCDEDIRNALRDLPKSLTEIYCRVLRRIKSRRHGKEAQKIFPWIAASKQSLSLSQLREAIAIEIGQQYSRPELLYNDIHNIALWCENLVQVDEEYQLVQFAHSTIKKFLIEEPLDSTLAEFRVDLQAVDHNIGEICVTYLNFNDLKTTIAQRLKPIKLHDTTLIAQSALGYRSKTASILAKLGPKPVLEPIDLSSLQSLSRNDSSTTYEKLILGYPFLDYASINWILHTRHFRREISKTWGLWENMVIYGHNLAKQPWGEETFNANGPILEWAYDAHHYALLRLAVDSRQLLIERRSDIILYSVMDNDVDALNILLHLEGRNSSNTPIHTVPVVAQRDLLEAIDKSFIKNWHRTVLQAAVEIENLEIAERLLTAGADVNAAITGGRTILEVALDKGNLKLVERLRATEVDGKILETTSLTILQKAIDKGNLKLVKRLLAVGADVNILASMKFKGRTPLQAAARKGDLGIVEALLAARAAINASKHGNWTALQAAAQGGHLEVVERLLIAGADINTSEYGDWTALHAAARGGNLEVVERLLAAGANVNAVAGIREGQTALQIAVDGGHLRIKSCLEQAGACG